MTEGDDTDANKRGRNLVKTGAAGTAIMGVCCFTPLLVIVLGAVGPSGWLNWMDFLLLPGLLIFVCILGYGLWQLKSS